MTQLAWLPVPGGFDAGVYRLRRLPGSQGRPWRLEIRRRGPGRSEKLETSSHHTLSGAKAGAAIHETERVKRLRVQLHIGFAALLAVVWVIQSSVAESSAAGYVVWLVLFVVVLKTLANASAAAIDDQEDTRTALFARWVRLDTFLPPFRRPADADAGAEEKVRLLDPTG